MATVRIHVERVNRQLREYPAFNENLLASGFDLASAENEVCQGLVTLKPEAHGHVQDSVDIQTAAEARRGMDLEGLEAELPEPGAVPVVLTQQEADGTIL